LNTWEGEGDRGERSGRTDGETGKGEQQDGESRCTGEENGEDTGSYLSGEGRLSSNIGENMDEGEEREEDYGGRVPSNSVTWSNNLFTTTKTSSRICLIRRFRIRLNWAREFRRRGTRGSTKIRTKVTTGLFVGAKSCKLQ